MRLPALLSLPGARPRPPQQYNATGSDQDPTPSPPAESPAAQGQPPCGRPSAAYRSRTPDRKTPTAMTVNAHRSGSGTATVVEASAVGKDHQRPSTGSRWATMAP